MAIDSVNLTCSLPGLLQQTLSFSLIPRLLLDLKQLTDALIHFLLHSSLLNNVMRMSSMLTLQYAEVGLQKLCLHNAFQPCCFIVLWKFSFNKVWRQTVSSSYYPLIKNLKKHNQAWREQPSQNKRPAVSPEPEKPWV